MSENCPICGLPLVESECKQGDWLAIAATGANSQFTIKSRQGEVCGETGGRACLRRKMGTVIDNLTQAAATAELAETMTGKEVAKLLLEVAEQLKGKLQ